MLDVWGAKADGVLPCETTVPSIAAGEMLLSFTSVLPASYGWLEAWKSCVAAAC